jgi:MFS family permease
MCNSYYGYDSSVYNAVQGDDDWLDWFNDPSAETIGGINTCFSVCAIVSGFFIAGTVADKGGRKVGMAAGSILIIIGSIIETVSPKGQIACFIVGRGIVGFALGLALGTQKTTPAASPAFFVVMAH